MQAIINVITGIIDIMNSIASAILFPFTMAIKLGQYVGSIASNWISLSLGLPQWLQGFVIATLSISIILTLIGRNEGTS